MWKRLISLSLTFGLAATAPPALAQAPCSLHDAITHKLTVEFGEQMVGRGLQSASRMYEVWRSPETGSWTIVAVGADGVTCIMASGFAWMDERPKPSGTKS